MVGKIRFKFVNAPVSYNTAEVFYVRLNPNAFFEKRELLKTYYYQLLFPGYFGFNWDALYDCLRDFHWMNEKKIVIVHDSIPSLSEVSNRPRNDLKIYVDVLHHSVTAWKEGDAHELEVIFQEKDKDRVTEILLQEED